MPVRRVPHRHILSYFAVFRLADELGHGSHGTVNTPAAGLEQDHCDKSQYRGCQHHAVKAEGELGCAGMEQRAVIGPVPRQLECPEQRDNLPKIPGSRKNQICIPEHLEKHEEEPDQEAISKGLALHPFGNVLFPGKAKTPSQQAEHLPPAAIAVAVAFRSTDNGDDQRDEKEEQADPGKQDVEKTQDQIGQFHDP